VQLHWNSQASLPKALGTITGIHAFDDGSLVLAEELAYTLNQAESHLYVRLTYWLPWRPVGTGTFVSLEFKRSISVT